MGSSRDLEQVKQMLHEAEAEFPVAEWESHGIRIWPIIRTRIGWDSEVVSHASRRQSSPVQRSLGILRREFGTVSRTIAASIVDRAMNLSPRRHGPCDVVFLSDGVSFTHMEDRYYERFCDPIHAYYQSQGYRCFKMTLSTPLLPRYSPSWLVGARLRVVRAWNMATRFLSHQGVIGRGLDAFAAHLRSRWGYSLPPWSYFAREARLVRQYSNFFSRALRLLRPRLAFIVSYYCDEGFAFCLACRRLGIPTVDLQHGVQGEYHAAYANWRQHPESGFEVMPESFWVWSDDEASVIRDWAAQLPRHQPVVGGNLFMLQCQAGQQSAPTIERLTSIHTPGAVHVLVTLQPGLDTPEFLQLITALIRTSREESPSWRWWVRLHPGALQRLPEITTWFHQAGLAENDIIVPTRLPLYALLPRVDVHLTHSSSTVLEADAFGIASVLASDYGMRLYPRQASSGMAILATDHDAIARALRSQLNRRRRLPDLHQQAEKELQAGYRTLDGLLRKDAPCFQPARRT